MATADNTSERKVSRGRRRGRVAASRRCERFFSAHPRSSRRSSAGCSSRRIRRVVTLSSRSTRFKDGTVVNHLTYDSFGNILTQTSSADEPRYTYTGREWDGDAELFQYRARWYDPAAGRFISEDPIGIAGGDPNLARYVGNDPGNKADPSGQQEKDEPNFTTYSKDADVTVYDAIGQAWAKRREPSPTQLPNNPPGVLGGLPPSATGSVETGVVVIYNGARYLWGTVVNTVQAVAGGDLGDPTSGRITVSEGPYSYYARLIRGSTQFQGKRYELLERVKTGVDRLSARKGTATIPFSHSWNMPTIAIYDEDQIRNMVVGQLTLGRLKVRAQTTGVITQTRIHDVVTGSATLTVVYTVFDPFHLHLATGIGLSREWEPGSFENVVTWSERVVVPIRRTADCEK